MKTSSATFTACCIPRTTEATTPTTSGKELSRIPAVKTFSDFRAFSQAGRDLAHWHLNYETVACHSGVTVEEGKMADAATGDRRYRVTKMKFAKTKDPVSGTKVNDKTTVIYKEFITLKNIPLAVYEWVLGTNLSLPTKTAVSATTPTSGPPKPLTTPSCRLEPFLRVVRVGLETMKVVNGLPTLAI